MSYDNNAVIITTTTIIMMIMLVIVVHTECLPQVSPSSLVIFRVFCQRVFKFTVSKMIKVLCYISSGAELHVPQS